MIDPVARQKKMDYLCRANNAACDIYIAKIAQFKAMSLMRRKAGMEEQRMHIHEALDQWLDCLNDIYQMAHGDAK